MIIKKACVSILATFLILAVAKTAPAGDELKIAYNADVAPLKFEDESGRAAGLFPEIWRLWAKKTGKTIDFIRTDSFNESLELVKNGQADLHAGLFRTAEREKFLA